MKLSLSCSEMLYFLHILLGQALIIAAIVKFGVIRKMFKIDDSVKLPFQIESPKLLSEHIKNYRNRQIAFSILQDANEEGLISYEGWTRMGDVYKSLNVMYPSLFNERGAHHALEICESSDKDGVPTVKGQTIGTGSNGFYSRSIELDGEIVATYSY